MPPINDNSNYWTCRTCLVFDGDRNYRTLMRKLEKERKNQDDTS